MHVYTLHVGQGQFVVVTGETEAFIVDTYVPLNPKVEIINVKAALATILAGKNLIGVMITGFDSDHFNEVGMKIVLNKYRPNWIMYPKYFKQTSTADACFSAIAAFQNSKDIERVSISLKDNVKRLYSNLSKEFIFEIFSPHVDDMNSSNNCSLVCKVRERATGASYLITGDTECQRWDNIAKHFGSALQSRVLAAPHHGSRHGITLGAMKHIQPHTVLTSAGVNNEYGHPHIEAKRIFNSHCEKHHLTNHDAVGQSLKTVITATSVNSFKFNL